MNRLLKVVAFIGILAALVSTALFLGQGWIRRRSRSLQRNNWRARLPMGAVTVAGFRISL
jgi:hypothetical protein